MAPARLLKRGNVEEVAPDSPELGDVSDESASVTTSTIARDCFTAHAVNGELHRARFNRTLPRSGLREITTDFYCFHIGHSVCAGVSGSAPAATA